MAKPKGPVFGIVVVGVRIFVGAVICLKLIIAEDLNITFVITLIAFFATLHDLDEVELCEVFVTKILSLFVGFFIGVQIANVNANKSSAWDVAQSPDSPTSAFRFKNLEMVMVTRLA